MKTFMMLVLCCVISVPRILFGALIISKLWTWFILQQFQLAALSTHAAVGIMIIINFFTIVHQRYHQEDDLSIEEKFEKSARLSAAELIFMYPLMLLIAYICHIVLS